MTFLSLRVLKFRRLSLMKVLRQVYCPNLLCLISGGRVQTSSRKGTNSGTGWTHLGADGQRARLVLLIVPLQCGRRHQLNNGNKSSRRFVPKRRRHHHCLHLHILLQFIRNYRFLDFPGAVKISSMPEKGELRIIGFVHLDKWYECTLNLARRCLPQ